MIKRYILEIVVFVCGGVLMILELCGSRILAPYMGTSLVVWTSLIGIILGSLSLGYYFGGRIADKKGSIRVLSTVIFLASVSTGSILLLRTPILTVLDSLPFYVGVKAVLATVCLFALPSVVFGMVTPLATKLRMESIKTAGTTVGNLYAFSTVGSIAGTFLAGFILLAYFSVTQILIGLSLVLLVLFAILHPVFLGRKIAVIVLLGLVIFLQSTPSPSKKVYESRYNHIEILTKGNIKVLQLDNKWHSAIYTNSSDLVFDYTKYYRLAKEINPEAKRILMIGGGAYSVPKDFLRLYEDIEMDVVEIDPFLTELAFREFGLKKDPRLTIYHEDGRTFLNREVEKAEKKYDAILVDVFSSFSIPFHLSTVEAVSKMNTLLNEKGVVITNIISSIEGERGHFLQAEAATYNSVFSQITLFPVDSFVGSHMQNLILIASKKEIDTNVSVGIGLNAPWGKEIAKKPVITDDFAPVDQYVRINEM